jgi:hypothetical protein
MKSFKISSLFFALILLATSCKKDGDTTPKDSFEGTWKLESAVITDSDGDEFDYWALYLFAYPCARNITYTFNDGKYTTNIPTGCFDEDGESLSLLAETGGTYTLNGDVVSVTTDEGVLPGQIKFEGNKAIVTTVDEDGDTVTITFVKA